MKTLADVSIESVQRAREVIQSTIVRTPIQKVHGLCRPGKDLFIKLENQQLTGSFKIRGAMNRMSSLSDEQRAKGVIASSAGNHAQGVAYSAKKLGVNCTIVMPENSPLVKVLATQNHGAKVILHGDYYDDAYQKARELEASEGYFFVHPFQDPYVISGQGTIGLEIIEDLQDVSQVVVPIGGGGLISGIAMTIKAMNPNVRIVGVVSSAAAGMELMFQGKSLDNLKVAPTICDGIAVKNPSPQMYENFISKYVDEIVEVNDEEVAHAIVYLMENRKTICEGSGAAGFAAVLSEKVELLANTCVLLCGGNIDLNTISRVIETGLRGRGRLTRVSVVVNDLPGSLDRLTNVLAVHGANVLDVDHDRASEDLLLRQTRIEFTLETKSHEHIKEIKDAINEIEGMKVDS